MSQLPKEDKALYRGAHFKDNEGFQANWDIVRGILEEISRPPLLPSISAHVCTDLPHRDKTTEIRSIELIHTLPISYKIEQKTVFLQICQYGYQKPQNFNATSKSEDEIEKKSNNKKLFWKN